MKEKPNLDAGDALFEIAVDTSNICPYCGTEDPPVDENDPCEWSCCIRERVYEGFFLVAREAANVCWQTRFHHCGAL